MGVDPHRLYDLGRMTLVARRGGGCDPSAMRATLTLAWASCCWLAEAGGVAAPAVPVMADDFEQDGGPVLRALAGDGHAAVVAGRGVGGGRALRIACVGGPMGSERVVRGIPLGEQGLDYTLNYDVLFEPGFQFVGGGKLHGLGPERSVTGGDPIRPDGWSARVMWRQQGRPELYTYHQDQQGKYGDHGKVVRKAVFATGRYQAVSLHVRLNDPASARNGFVRMYVDGALVERHEGVRLRGVEDARISRFLFSTFHGGNDPSWAPKTPDGGYATLHALFDNIAVYRGERIRAAPGA
jgi:hypothetical protein